MKKLFYKIRVYNYTSIEEVEKHKKGMKKKGWCVRDTYENLADGYPYSIEYCK